MGGTCMENNNQTPFSGNNANPSSPQPGAEPVKSSTGIEENIESLLCYLFPVIGGIIFLLIEKNSKLTKFHAIQSLILGIVFWVLYFIINSVLLVAFWYLWSFVTLLITLIWIGYAILSIVLMVKSYKREWFKLPLIGNFAENSAKK